MTSITGVHLKEFLGRYIRERDKGKKYRTPKELLKKCHEFIENSMDIIGLINYIYKLKQNQDEKCDIYKININEDIAIFHKNSNNSSANNWISLKC